MRSRAKGRADLTVSGGRWRVVPALGALLALALSAVWPVGAGAAPYQSVSVIGPTGNGVFRFPQAVAFSEGGEFVFVADQYSTMVQKFRRNGEFVAQWGFYGTGPGQMRQIGGLATDAAHRVYVLDSLNSRVQVFDSRNATYLGGWGGFGRAPGEFDLGIGGGIAVHGASAYVADQNNHRVQRFALDAATGLANPTPQLVWGTFGDCASSCTETQLNTPQGIAVSSSPGFPNQVFVADNRNHRVLRFGPDGTPAGQIGTPGVGGDEEGQFAAPYDVGVDRAHALYVADNNNHRVQKFDAATLEFVDLWGGFGSGPGSLEFPRALAALASDPQVSGAVYVADTANNRIQALDPDGNLQLSWGISGRGPGVFTRPEGVALDRAANIYVADSFSHRIQKLSANGTFIQAWGRRNTAGYPASGTAAGEFNEPHGLAVDARNGDLYVADTLNNRVQRFSVASQRWATLGNITLKGPRGVTVDERTGDLYVADTGGSRILRRSASGAWSTVPSTVNGVAVSWPEALDVDGGGNLYVADTRNNRVIKRTIAGAWSTLRAGLNQPAGVTVSAAGIVVISDTLNHKVMRLNADGTLRDEWGTNGPAPEQFVQPGGVATDASGNVYVADVLNHRLQRFSFAS